MLSDNLEGGTHIPIELRIQKCISTTSGNLLNSATYGGNSICGKTQTSLEIAKNHIVTWSHTSPTANMIRVKNGGTFQIAHEGNFQGKIILEEGSTLQITENASLPRLHLEGNATIQIAHNKTLQFPRRLALPFYHTLKVQGGTMTGEEIVVYGTLATDQTTVHNHIMVAHGTLQPTGQSQFLGKISYPSHEKYPQQPHLLQFPHTPNAQQFLFALLDWDGDGDQDMMVRDASYGINYYRNVGTIDKPVFKRKMIPRVLAQFIGANWLLHVNLLYENQNIKYLFTSGYSISRLFKNIGNSVDHVFLNPTIIYEPLSSANFVDFNGDTENEILFQFHMRSTSLHRNKRLSPPHVPFAGSRIESSLAVLDFDGDGDSDIFAPASRRIFYLENIQQKPTPEMLQDVYFQELHNKGKYFSKWQNNAIFSTPRYRGKPHLKITDLNDDNIPEFYIFLSHDKLSADLFAYEFFPHQYSKIIGNQATLKLANTLHAPDYSKLDIAGTNTIIEGDIIANKLNIASSTHIDGNVKSSHLTTQKPLVITQTLSSDKQGIWNLQQATTIESTASINTHNPFAINVKDSLYVKKLHYQNPQNTDATSTIDFTNAKLNIDKELKIDGKLDLTLLGKKIELPKVLKIHQGKLILPEVSKNPLTTEQLLLEHGKLTTASTIQTQSLHVKGQSVLQGIHTLEVHQPFSLNDANVRLTFSQPTRWKESTNLQNGLLIFHQNTVFEKNALIGNLIENTAHAIFQQKTTLSSGGRFLQFRNAHHFNRAEFQDLTIEGTLQTTGSTLHFQNLKISQGTLLTDSDNLYFPTANPVVFSGATGRRAIFGIGATTFYLPNEKILIHSLLKGGAADKDGNLKPNDQIVAIAEGDRDYETTKLSNKIKGVRGSKIRLKVERNIAGTLKTQEIVLHRDEVITRPTIQAKLLSSTINPFQVGRHSLWNIEKTSSIAIESSRLDHILLSEVKGEVLTKESRFQTKQNSQIFNGASWNNQKTDITFENLALNGIFKNQDSQITFENLQIVQGVLRSTGGTLKFPIATPVKFQGQGLNQFQNVALRSLRTGQKSIWHLAENVRLHIEGGSLQDIQFAKIKGHIIFNNLNLSLDHQLELGSQGSWKSQDSSIRFQELKLDGTFTNQNGELIFEKLDLKKGLKSTGGTLKFPIATSVTFQGGTVTRFENAHIQSLIAGQKSIWYIDPTAKVNIIGGSIKDIVIKTGILETKGTKDKGGNTKLITSGDSDDIKNLKIKGSEISVPADKVKQNPDKSYTFTKKTTTTQTKTTIFPNSTINIKKTTTRQGKEITTELDAPANTQTQTDRQTGIIVTETQPIPISGGRTSKTRTSIYPDGKVTHETIISAANRKETITRTDVPQGVKVKIASSGYSAIEVSDFINVADPTFKVDVTKIKSLIGLEGRTKTLIYTQDQANPTIIDAPLNVHTKIHALGTMQQYIPTKLAGNISVAVNIHTNRKGQLFALYHTKNKDGQTLHAQAYPVFKNGTYIKTSFNFGQGQLTLIGAISKLSQKQNQLLIGQSTTHKDNIYLSQISDDFRLRLERNLLAKENQMLVEQGQASLIQKTLQTPIARGATFQTNNEAIPVPVMKDWTLISLPIQQSMGILERELFLAQFSQLKTYHNGKWLLETPDGSEHPPKHSDHFTR